MNTLYPIRASGVYRPNNHFSIVHANVGKYGNFSMKVQCVLKDFSA